MTPIEMKKVKSELLRVQAAKAELEYIIAQRLEEVSRLEETIKKQEDAERELLSKLA